MAFVTSSFRLIFRSAAVPAAERLVRALPGFRAVGQVAIDTRDKSLPQRSDVLPFIRDLMPNGNSPAFLLLRATARARAGERRSGSTVCPTRQFTSPVRCGHSFCKTGGITVFAIRLAK